MADSIHKCTDLCSYLQLRFARGPDRHLLVCTVGTDSEPSKKSVLPVQNANDDSACIFFKKSAMFLSFGRMDIDNIRTTRVTSSVDFLHENAN